jgi:hypothetical protein
MHELALPVPMKRRSVLLALVLTGITLSMGCSVESGESTWDGPGHRAQVIALSPEQELALGREVYQEILDRADVVPSSRPEARRVRQVGERLIGATKLELLMKEINIPETGYRFPLSTRVRAVTQRRISDPPHPFSRPRKEPRLLALVVVHRLNHITT